jgi:hypothetical protein
MERQAGEADKRIETLVSCVVGFDLLDEAGRERLRAMAGALLDRGHPPSFVLASLRSTARVLDDLNEEAEAGEGFGRADVKRFMDETGARRSTASRQPARREWKLLERERLFAHTVNLVRDARCARLPHEMKKTRNLLMKVDQRQLRRVLGEEGEELSRQIRGLLREFAGRM